VETLLQDFRFGLRMLRKSPGFTAVAIFTLALGIGANTAIFSAVNGILLKPLPYAQASQLVSLELFKQFPNGNRGIRFASVDAWEKMRAQTSAIGQMAFWNRDQYNITGETAPEQVPVAHVSSDFFPLMGALPIAGRPILSGDAQPGAKPVAVISYALWKSRWGGDTGVLNRTITLNSQAYTIIGVMPLEFSFPISKFDGGDKGIWLPLILSPGQKDGHSDVFPVARLKKGVSVAAANAQLKTIRVPALSGQLASSGMWHFLATPVKTRFNDLDNPLLILVGAVGFVLLIACVNVSGLLLARGWARHREVAIREALGASRIRIVRQFLSESILLALAGGALGLLLSIWGVHVLRAITPTDLPEHGHFALNANILWFTLAVSLLTGILFGLAPALQASTRRVGAAIRDGFGSLAGTSRRPHRLRSALVVVEIALAVILVVGATLVARSLQKLLSVKLGFRTDHIVTMDANFSKSTCDSDNPTKTLAGCKAAVSDVLQRMSSISAVQSASVSSVIPLTGWDPAVELKIEGRAEEFSLDSGAMISTRAISPDYFRTFDIPLLSGRGFSSADTSGSQRVAIVNEAFAKKYLNGRALGRRISTRKDSNPEWMEVIGVVASTHDTSLEEPHPLDEIYIPYTQQNHVDDTYFIARTSADPAVMIPALRRAVWSEDKNAPITDVLTMDQIVADSVAEPRFQALLLGSFGALGLILALVGIYGVISFGVTQRTHEIGVRMALGAQPGNVLRIVIRESMVLAGFGIVIGIGGALALTRFLRSLLFEVKPTDAATFVGVAVVLAVVAMAACWIPARRAMRVEPMEALRYE
jgi:predicted permease